jgi:hypothetical protein
MPDGDGDGDGDGPDLESRWRQWQTGSEPQPPGPGQVDAGGRLRPPGARVAALVACSLGLLALVVFVVAKVGADRTPEAVLPGGGPAPATSTPAARHERDLTALASADASGFAASTTDAGGAIVSYLPVNVLDGDPGTAWRTTGPGDGETLTLDFSREVTVTKVEVAVGEPAVGSGADAAANRRGREVQQVTWTVGETTTGQSLDPARLDLQVLALPEPVTTRSLTLRLDRTAPGPVATDDFAAVTQVVVLGVR